jgi:transposase
MDITTYGMDIAKSVFQLHWVDADTGEVHRKKLARAKVSEFFAKRLPGHVAMEACGGAHHWARALAALGHQVELLPAHQVRAFVTGNKDDAADARAIWLAARQGDLRRVAVKSCQQQAELSLHRMRSHWVGMRTATVNALRGLLYEFGVTLLRGKRVGMRYLAEHRAEIDAQLPATMVRLLNDQLLALQDIERHVQAMDQEIEVVQKTNETARRLREVPGIGVLGATALASSMGDGAAWRSAREFASCHGLTPGHSGTGGKVRMAGITKRGDSYLRTLLMHGARSIIRVANPAAWIVQLLERRPFNVVVAAVAHKLARIAWAIVAKGRQFQAEWKSMPPGASQATPVNS